MQSPNVVTKTMNKLLDCIHITSGYHLAPNEYQMFNLRSCFLSTQSTGDQIQETKH